MPEPVQTHRVDIEIENFSFKAKTAEHGGTCLINGKYVALRSANIEIPKQGPIEITVTFVPKPSEP